MVVFQDLPSQGLILFKAKPNTGEPAFLPYLNVAEPVFFPNPKIGESKKVSRKTNITNQPSTGARRKGVYRPELLV